MATGVVGPSSQLSKRLIAAYVLDWIAIIVFVAIATAINTITPNAHPFSLLDLSLSYPSRPDTVSTTNLFVASVIGPAIIIFLVAFIFVPGRAASQNISRSQLLRWKIWEWNTGWLGLALSSATAVLVTQGIKNIIGKPRPDMLAVCNPDITNVASHVVGGYGQDISARWTLVDTSICQQTDNSALHDAFRSFPSGHSSTSFAGLLYLTLYLCSKFAVVFPYLPTEQINPSGTNLRTQANGRPLGSTVNRERSWTRHRDEAAAPPAYLLLLAYIPLGVAIFIAGSRWFNYKHHGFDILSGVLIGTVTAYFGFRWYHLPLTKGSGWSWGPRSPDRAFGIGIGRHGFVDEEARFADVDLDKRMNGDVELRENHGQWVNRQDGLMAGRTSATIPLRSEYAPEPVRGKHATNGFRTNAGQVSGSDTAVSQFSSE